ncbi:MAG TPA: hypothetical protein VMX35_08160 [Acidobacteriota bacterium]|nr:hypothetical protein [Acidobacteriota bacterium]
MSWGVELLYWCNTALLGLLGAAVLATRRWRHLRWFPFYALVIFFLSVVYLLWQYTPEFSLMKRLVGELLALGVVVEVLRKEADRRPKWPWLALISLTLVPFLPLDPYTRYYLPQEIFAIGLALELPTALRSRSAPLLAWSVIGIATITSDSIKLMSPSLEVLQILRMLDPLVFTVFIGILVTGFFLPEIARLAKSLQRFALGRKQKLPKLPFANELAPARSHAAESEWVVAFPDQRNSLVTARIPVTTEPSPGCGLPMESLSRKLEALALAIETSSRISLSLKKPFLSPQDLALYLGVEEATARKFVELRELVKIQLTDAPGEWVVFRADVDEKLGDS